MLNKAVDRLIEEGVSDPAQWLRQILAGECPDHPVTPRPNDCETCYQQQPGWDGSDFPGPTVTEF
jgi:hypothetical protein